MTNADLGGKTFFLGRPWRSSARVIFMETELPASLDPLGWKDWKSNAPIPSAVFFAEFRNSGPGAAGTRVPWAHQLSPAQAAAFEPRQFLKGVDGWDAVAAAAKLP